MMERRVTRVKDVMVNAVNLVEGIDTVSHALRKMQTKRSPALIVNKRHEDDEYGIVLLSDIARQVLARDKAPDRVNIYEIMSKPVIAVDSNMDIRYCARLFGKFGIHHAPVIDNGELIGMVSYWDMVLRGLYQNIDVS
jgi:CBS domain-containing protein